MKLYNNIGKFAVAITCGLLLMGNVSAQSCGVDVSLNNSTLCYNYINTTGTGVTVQNSGTILANSSISTQAITVGGGSVLSIFNTNTGTIGNGSTSSAIWQPGGSIGTITNEGVITGYYLGIGFTGSTIAPTLINNSGAIYGGTYGIFNSAGITVGNITNSGSIYAPTSGYSFGIYNAGTIGTLTNTGAIYGSSANAGIENYQAVINIFNNAQGGNSSTAATTALTYTGTLPTHYNIIINSPTSYGQLAVTSGTGNTTFGIYSSSTALNGHVYASVLSGITASQLGGSGTTINGVSNGISYSLVETGSNTDIWNLDILSGGIFPGPSTANTQQSLVNTAQALQSTYTLQNSVLANSFSYDCTEFGANGICISAGGRNTAVSAANGLNNTSGLLIAAYRPHQNYRVGAYVDQNLSVNNAGSTVNLGNNTPLIGLFGAWNERVDGTGTEVKVSAAYGQKNTTVNRSVVGSGDTASEAGSGGSKLNSQGAQVTAKYGFGVADQVVVSPYVGIRYTQNNMGGYTEGTSATVTAPLTYSALNTNATTALAGVGASYKGIPQTTLFASAGVETDTNTANGSYVGNNAYFAGGLTPVNFNANPVKTRPTASLGAYYDIVKNQRVGITGIYRQEAYQAVSTTTVMATYTVGL